jgi:3-keto-disaccharide hydrolase
VKLPRLSFITAAAAVIILGVCFSNSHVSASSENPSAIRPLLGRWDLTLKAPDRDYPSWLELKEESGVLSAQMVGRWGNARPLPKVEFSGGQLTFVSPKEEEGSKEDLNFQGRLSGATLKGAVNGPDGKAWQWVGVRAPTLSRTGTPRWGKPVPLFDGKDLGGWTMSASGPRVWTVQDGTIVSPGNGPELVSNSKFQDFKLHIEFNCGKDSNSGVYLRGRYEVQIETESEAEPPSHHTGGVYGFLAPTPELPRAPDKWQTFDITLIGRRVTVIQNGAKIIDNQEIPGITGGAVDSHEASPGPIYLQGSEKGHVAFRNIVITPGT